MHLPARRIAGTVALVMLAVPAPLDAQQERDVRGAANAAVWHAVANSGVEGDFVIASPDPLLTAWLTRETGAVTVPDRIRSSCGERNRTALCIARDGPPVVEIRGHELDGKTGTVDVMVVTHSGPDPDRRTEWSSRDWRLEVVREGDGWGVAEVVWIRIGN